MNVGIVDNNGKLLDRAKKELEYGDPSAVDVYEVDVGSDKDWEILARDVKGAFGKVDFLVLNAGVGGKGDWGDGGYFRTVCITGCSDGIGESEANDVIDSADESVWRD